MISIETAKNTSKEIISFSLAVPAKNSFAQFAIAKVTETVSVI